MKISPIEIKQKTFERQNLGGYKREEVHAFLLLLSQEWEKIFEENREYKIRVELLEKEIAKLKEVEGSLFRTLKTAEDTSANIIEQARKNAEIKIKEAQVKADVILNDARQQAKNIVQKSQIRSRNVVEEVLMELRNKEFDYKEIEKVKQNLLLELKNYLNESLEKINRFENKNQSDFFASKIKETEEYLEEKNQTLDELDFKEQQSLLGNTETNLSKPIEEEDGNSFFDELSSLK